MRPFPLHEVIETARIAALDSYAILDTPNAPRFDALAQTAADALAMPIAQISFIGRTRHWTKASVGHHSTEMPRHVSFCQSTLDEASGVTWIEDASTEPRFRRHPWVILAPHVRSYAGAALIDGDGYRLGTIAALDIVPRPRDPAALARLRQLSVVVVAALANHRAGLVAMPLTPKTEPVRWSQTRPPTPWMPTTNAAPPPPQMVQGWLGVRTGPASALGGEEPGLMILSVAQESPAEQAGIRIEDTLISIGQRPIRRSSDIPAALSQCRAGDIILVQIRRAGHELSLPITVEPIPPAHILKRRVSARTRR